MTTSVRFHFDLDGTLVGSSAVLAAALNKVLAVDGLEPLAVDRATAPSADRAAWTGLEEAARSAASMGGIAAMGFYRGVLLKASKLDKGRNPSTEADVRATAGRSNYRTS